MSLRERRIANELAMLVALAECNADVLQINASSSNEFDVTLSRTTGLVRSMGGLVQRSEHRLTLRFPRYFPSLPIEAYFRHPVFHPNVDVSNGFACLWLDPSPRHNVFHALQMAQALITFRTQNLDPRHLTQTEAVSATSPLPFTALVCPPDWGSATRRMRAALERRRLTSA